MNTLTRRGFLRLSLWTAGGIVLLEPLSVFGGTGLAIIENAGAVILADPSRCVGCGRCELACTEFKTTARPSPPCPGSRSAATWPSGPWPFGAEPASGLWGNGLIVQDTCRQCHHPVPCAEACPVQAIVADPATGARRVDPARCTGCRLCLNACPLGHDLL